MTHADTHTHTKAHCFSFSIIHTHTTHRHVLREDLSIGSLSIQPPPLSLPPPSHTHTTPLFPPPPLLLSFSLSRSPLCSPCLLGLRVLLLRQSQRQQASSMPGESTHTSIPADKQAEQDAGEARLPGAGRHYGTVGGRGRDDVGDRGGKCWSGQWMIVAETMWGRRGSVSWMHGKR